MKKTLALILALIMIVACFAGCGNTADTPAADAPDAAAPKLAGKDISTENVKMAYIPVSTAGATTEIAQYLAVGTHGTTYGGNPLAGAVAGELLSIVNTPEVLSGVRQRHQWFCERLQAINARYGLFKEIRGLGLLLGCVLNDAWAGKAKTLSNLAAEEGVMILIAGANVVRFAPALNVSEEEVNSGLDRVERACARFVAGVSS